MFDPFDPFDDFESAGYLRNRHQVKDAEVIKRIEHDLFVVNLPDAEALLSTRETIVYEDFLTIHHLLFSEFYPWAGQDRLITRPFKTVSKADVEFCHPQDIKRAITEGLRLAQIKEVMKSEPGMILGLFAYGHPFLDGNGRTMLIIHSELCKRAGFSISWDKVKPKTYLKELSKEIINPGGSSLDGYLLKFKESR